MAERIWRRGSSTWWKTGCANADEASPRAAPVVVWVLVLALGACHGEPESHRRLIPVFGTMAEVEILDADHRRAELALDRVESLYLELDRDWRSFGDGELGRANAALLAGEPAELSPALERLLRRALEFRETSGGLFDPLIGGVVAAWGFEDMARRTPAGPPPDSAIDAARDRSLGARLRLSDGRVSSDAPVSLDLNGLAEGAALTAGAELLAGLGVRNALIDTGGDLLAMGDRGGRPWRVGIRDPRDRGVLGRVDLDPGESIASSGTYEHRFGPAGEHHHVLDPRTGRPALGALGATVISRDAELADAAATALLVAGPGLFDETARRMGVEFAVLVSRAGETIATPGMRRRIQWEPADGATATRRAD